MAILMLTRPVDISRPVEEEASERLMWREVGRLGPEEIRAEFVHTFSGLAKVWDNALTEEAAEKATPKTHTIGENREHEGSHENGGGHRKGAPGRQFLSSLKEKRPEKNRINRPLKS